MASTRPPKTYSPSFRTGRRSEGSGGVVGMVRCAGCDAWPGSLRSSMRTSREACSGWGAVELSFLGATLHVSTHAPSTCTDVSTPRAGPAQRFQRRERAPPPRRRNRQAATARPGGGLQDCPVGRPACDGGSHARPGGAIAAPGRARREVVLNEGGRRRGGDGRDATAVPSPPGAVSAPRPSASAAVQQQQRKRERADHRQSRHRRGVRDDRELHRPSRSGCRSGCRPRPARPRPRCPPSRCPRPRGVIVAM